MNNYPETIANEEQLEELLSRPSAETVEMFKKLEGDIIFLGIAGKIGPSLANMAKRACGKAGVKKRIFGVSRFRNQEEKEQIENFGIETIQGDLRAYLGLWLYSRYSPPAIHGNLICGKFRRTGQSGFCQES